MVSNSSQRKKTDEPFYNPYETPATDQFESPNAKFRTGSTKVVLLWTLLVPAVIANVLFWTYFGFHENFGPRGKGYHGENLLIYLITVVPFVGLLYGITLGGYFTNKPMGKHRLLSPLVQGLFQPFWFFISVTAGCFVVIPIFFGP